MKTKYLCALFFCALTIIPISTKAAVTSSTIGAASNKTESQGEPWWVYIPSIDLSTSVKGVGIDVKGNMDVPSGRTMEVGWYKYGAVPGANGTAVLDAHNTAAFQDLYMVKEGDEIDVYLTNGEVRKFVVGKAHTYSMTSLSPLTLFAPSDGTDLNLITCAGTLLGNGEATHRLIVSAELLDEVIPTVTSSTIAAR